MKRALLLGILSLILLCGCAAPVPEEQEQEPEDYRPSVDTLDFSQAAPGTEIEIAGSNFFSMRSANEVWMGDFQAPVVFASSDKLRVLVPPIEPGLSSLYIHTPEGYSSEFDFKVLPLQQLELPLGTTTQDVLELSDQLLIRLATEPAGRELSKEIEEARYFVSQAIESLEGADEERLQTVDMVLYNSKTEGRINKLLVNLQGTPHVTPLTIATFVAAVGGFAEFVIGIFVTPAFPLLGIALISAGAVQGTASIVAAIYMIDEDLEEQKRE